MIARLALVAALALAGCPAKAPLEDTGPPDLSGFDPDAVTRAREDCRKRGGNWSSGGLASGQVCIVPTRDANKHCTAGTACEGLCLARSQTCAPVTPFFGCHEVLTDNGVQATLCID